MKKIINYQEYAYKSGNPDNLKSFTVPNGIEIIDEEAFEECTFEEIILPDSVKYIGKRAFALSPNLKKVVLSKNLIYIGNNAFCECHQLEDIVMTDNIEIIGKRAFSKCAIKKVEFGNNLLKLGEEAFMECLNLEEVIFNMENVNLEFSIFSRCKKLEKVVLPSKLEILPNATFSDCLSLKNINLPSSIKKIGDFAFNNTGLEKIDMSNLMIDKISSHLFSRCINLKEVKFPLHVKKILHSSFAECGMESLNLPEGIIEIGNNVFARSKLKSIILPSSIESIEECVFDSTDIEEITIPEKINWLPSYFIANCYKLKKINFLSDDIKEISFKCFFAAGFNEFDIPKSITKIDDSAFAYSNLKRITIPENITEMGYHIFDNCKFLEEIIIKAKLKKINKFGYDLKLKRIEFPNSMRHLVCNYYENCEYIFNTSLFDMPKFFKKGFKGKLFINGVELNPNNLSFKSKLDKLRKEEIRKIVMEKLSTYNLYQSKDLNNIVRMIWSLKFDPDTFDKKIDDIINNYFKGYNVISKEENIISKIENTKPVEQVLSELLNYEPKKFNFDDIMEIQKYGDDLNSYLSIIAKEYTNNILKKKEIELELSKLKEKIDEYFSKLKSSFSQKSILNYEELGSFIGNKIIEVDSEIKRINQNNYLIKLYALNVQKLINVMEEYTSNEYENSNIILSKINELKKGSLTFEAECSKANIILSNYLSLYQILTNIRDLYLPVLLVNSATKLEDKSQKQEFVLNNISELLTNVTCPNTNFEYTKK